MRELKFRAWDKKQKVMVYDNDRWTPQGVSACYPVSVSNKGIIFCKRGQWGNENTVTDEKGRIGYQDWEYDQFYQDIELMQWTGLKDKNGKEIYEKDLVKHSSPFWDGNSWDGEREAKTPHIVVWDSIEDFDMGLSNQVHDGESLPYDTSSIRIIGNIYENPEIEYQKPVYDEELSK